MDGHGSYIEDAVHAQLGTDQVKRRIAFQARHPEITILSPRQTGTGNYEAQWTHPSQHPDGDAVIAGAKHHMLRFLLDYLEAQFDQ